MAIHLNPFDCRALYVWAFEGKEFQCLRMGSLDPTKHSNEFNLSI